MLVGIEIVTNLIGRCAIFEELYPGSRVTVELVSLYAKILTYLVAARNYYSSSMAGKILILMLVFCWVAFHATQEF